LRAPAKGRGNPRDGARALAAIASTMVWIATPVLFA
jgi:hypothetical protein